MKRLLAAAVAVFAFVGALTFLQVLPVKAYVDQRNEERQTVAHLQSLKADNAELRARAKRLKTGAEVERLAREEFGMVKPGEVVYAIPGLVREGQWSDEASAGATTTTVAPKPMALWRRALDKLTFWT